MNMAYINEVQQRLFVPCTDLESLCKDIPSEIFAPCEYANNNGYYGIDVALKDYVGLPHMYPLKAHYSHGSIAFEGYIWVKDYDTLPMLFTWSPAHEKVYKQVCKKPMYSIGPIIHYAQNAYTDAKISSERARLGRNALFFPTHSSHHATSLYPIENTLEHLEAQKKNFDTLRVSIYWKDFLDARHKPYVDAGYECVSAGHIFDPYFLPRLKALLSVTDHTFGNSYGSNICYSIYMKIPHTHWPQEITRDHSKDPARVDQWTRFDLCKEMLEKFLQNFTQFSSEISPMQYKMCNHYFGYDCIRTREELLTLLQTSEELFYALMRRKG